MVPNRISEEVNPEALAGILEKIEEVQAALPFLVGLDPIERRSMLKAGDRSQAFIRKAMEVAPHMADYLPRGLDVEEMRKDVGLMDALYPIMIATSRLAEKLADTYAVVSSEAYASALVIYRNSKYAKGGEGLEQAVADLRRRFARRPRNQDDGAPGEQSPAEPAA